MFCGRSDAQTKLVRRYLAGSHLSIAQRNFIKYDTASGYYLVSRYTMGEGTDEGRKVGATLLLTPDQGDVENMFLKVKIQKTHLPRLRTGTGVNIGDTAAQVRSKVGPKPYVDRTTGQLSYSYKKRFFLSVPKSTGYRKRLYHYSACYYFYNGRVEAIRYDLYDAAYVT